MQDKFNKTMAWLVVGFIVLTGVWLSTKMVLDILKELGVL